MTAPDNGLGDPEAASAWTSIGYVVKPHGIRGELRLQLDMPWESLQGEVSHVRLVPRGGGAAKIAGIRVRPIHRGVLVSLDGIDCPEAAAPWRGADVQVRTAHIPPCDAGEFYVAELRGTQVFDDAGVPLGTMQDVLDNAGQPLGVIKTGDGAERLLPLVPQTIRRFERETCRLHVSVPLGLWDA